MRTQCFTITIMDAAENEDQVLKVIEGVRISPVEYKGESQTGILTGQSEKPDGIHDKFFRVYGETASSYVSWLSVSSPDARGVRYARRAMMDDAVDEDQVLVHLDFSDPNWSARLYNGRDLTSQNLLYEGRIQTTVGERKRFSCQGVLLAQINEEYKFSFWSPVQRKNLIASFHFNGEDLVISEIVPRTPRTEGFRTRKDTESRPRRGDPFNGLVIDEPRGHSQHDRKSRRREYDRKYRDDFRF